MVGAQDALILQRIALQTKMELSSEDLEDGGVPDVRGLVQELLTNLFISVYNHQVPYSTSPHVTNAVSA